MKPGPRLLLTLLAVLHLTGAVASENSIAFLGPKGSYSDQAASEYASRAKLTGATPLGTITQIAQSMRDGRVQYGLLPFENSIGGFVGETPRLLLAPQDPGCADLEQIQSTLRSTSASLIGAYRLSPPSR